MAITGGSLTDANGNAITSQTNGSQQALDVGVNVAGVQVDPRQIRPLTATDVVNVQDITGTVSLPTGASTAANQATEIASLSSIDSKLNSLGQKAMAASVPVVVASDQSAIPVTTQTPNGSLIDHSGTTSATPNTSTQIMASNSSRKYLIIQNVSNATMWINFGVAAVENQPSFQIIAGASFAMEGSFVSTQAVNVICNGPSKAFTAKEA